MDDGTWGIHLNANADVLDAVLGSNVHGPFLPLAGGTVTGATIFGGSVRHNSTVGFNNTAPIARPTGWGAATGTATRSTFVTSSVTLPTLAEHVKALIDDLIAYGLIGP